MRHRPLLPFTADVSLLTDSGISWPFTSPICSVSVPGRPVSSELYADSTPASPVSRVPLGFLVNPTTFAVTEPSG